MKTLALVLAASFAFGVTAASADTVTIKHKVGAVVPNRVVVKHKEVTGSVGCKVKIVDKINDRGEHVHKKVRKC